MAVSIDVNGVAISYPQAGDVGWAADATQFAVQSSAALAKIGLSTGTDVVVQNTLEVLGDAIIQSDLDVVGKLDVDNVEIVNGLIVDTDVLLVDSVNNRVGINNAIPSVDLEVTGDAIISNDLTVGNDLSVGNNLDVTLDLDVNGSANIGVDLDVTGTLSAGSLALTDLTIDTDLIKTDSTNNRVGINIAIPTEALDVVGNIKSSGLNLNSDGSATNPSITFSSDLDSGLYRIGSNQIGIATNGARVGEIGTGHGGFIGNVLQVVYVELTTTGTVSNPVIPFDDTIPQNTEGHELLTLSITPKYANSLLIVESSVFIGENANLANGIASALFRDSDANAIASRFEEGMGTANSPLGANLSHDFMDIQKIVVSGSTSATTFKTRVGLNNNNGTLRWNGTSARYGGGTMISYMKITEVMQ